MKMFFKFLILGVLFAASQGGSVAGFVQTECTIEDVYQLHSCRNKIENLAMKLPDFHPNDPQDVEDMQSSCESVKECSSPLARCSGESPKTIEEYKKAIHFMCEILIFAEKDLAHCVQKKGSGSRNCGSWESTANDENMVNKFCRNIHEKEDCLKKEVMERCGEKKWAPFRDMMIKQTEKIDLCDSKQLEEYQ